MIGKLKKGYHQLVIDDEPGNLIVTTRLSKKQFKEKLKTNRLTFGRMHSDSVHITNFNSNISW
jgi:hypothetical protein